MTITIEEGGFRRDGRPHQIISGAVHYFRVPPSLWEDRLRRVRALGLNTVETYVAWNYHERTRGEVDFTGPRDLARFITIAGELGLDVIVRPGPYICAEWDFGGFPAWLLREPVTLRSSDPAYLVHVDAWLDALIPVLLPLQSTNGGPVIGVQVENEYGSYGSDAAYLEHLRSGLVARGIDTWLFTSDGAGPDWLVNGTVPGVHATANFGSQPREAITALREFQPDGPDMVMEYWNGWFDHWGEDHHVRDADDAATVLAELLRLGASVNLYMAHGGTNHGLWNGANHPEEGYQPTVTSYDYDAAIGEAGELTAKFFAFRDVIAAHTGVTPPPPPGQLPRQAPAALIPNAWASLLDHTDLFAAPKTAPRPLSFEELDADHGLVLYRGSTFVPPDGRDLILAGIADRAQLIVDGIDVGTFDRNDPEPRIPMLPGDDDGRCELKILVENQGRTNFGPPLGGRKGLDAVRLCNRTIHGWSSQALRIDEKGWLDGIRWGVDAPSAGPKLARFSVDVDGPADGFIALPGWGKGFVWLNGTMLGRYWEIGPQATLYAAAPLWRPGLNELVVLELLHPGSVVELRDQPDLGPTSP